MNKLQLKQIVYDCMLMNERELTLIEITKLVYNSLIEEGITPNDNIFYTYQYDLRWCLQSLRNENLTSFEKQGSLNVHYLCA